MRRRSNPVDRVRELIHEAKNHFPELDEAAEALASDLAATGHEPFFAIAERLHAKHGIRVRVMPIDVMPDSLAPLRPPPPPAPDLRTGGSVRQDLPGRLPIGLRRDARHHRCAGRAPGAGGRAGPAAPAGLVRQLLRRRADDALRQVPRGGGGARLRRRGAGRPLRRELRAGGAPAHDAGPRRRARHSRSSWCGWIRPATCRSASRPAASRSRSSAAPARSGTCTPLSARPASGRPRSSSCRTPPAGFPSPARSSAPSTPGALRIRNSWWASAAS